MDHLTTKTVFTLPAAMAQTQSIGPQVIWFFHAECEWTKLHVNLDPIYIQSLTMQALSEQSHLNSCSCFNAWLLCTRASWLTSSINTEESNNNRDWDEWRDKEVSYLFYGEKSVKKKKKNINENIKTEQVLRKLRKLTVAQMILL